jgi:C-terminal processing protease CtpA/Prc
MRKLARVLPVLLSLAIVPLGAQQPAAPPARTISKYDRGLGLTMLSQVKVDLKDNYYDKTFHGMDVDTTFADAERRLKAANTVSETVAIIAELLMRLNDSHTTFLPPDRRARVVYGWQASMIGDAPYVTDVLRGSDAEKKGLAPGDRIVAWNRYEVTRDNLWQIYYLYNFVRPQVLQRIVVRKPDGTEKTIDVESKLQERPPQMNLEDLLTEILTSAVAMPAVDQWTTVGDTFVWRSRSFLLPKQMDDVVKKARNATSMVLDLRGNAGGNVEAMRELAARLFDREVRIAVETTRRGDKPLDARGRKDAFTGPLVVLVDSGSASASEITARLVQLEKRGTVIGDRTAGAVMTARFFPHTLGIDSVAFYATTITVGDVHMTDGGALEHVGVTPDEIVLPTGADLAAGRDPVLARAIVKLGGSITPEQAGKLFR